MIFGLKKEPKKEYELIIIGGGPAGCTAAIYAKRFLIDTLIIAKRFGGLVNDAEIIDNYPGLPEMKGEELAKKFFEHMLKYKPDYLEDEVLRIEKKGGLFKVITREHEIFGKAIIVATGEVHRELNVEGEKELRGKGVSYCAICDAPLFKNRIVAVIGGGNTAFIDAQLLAKYAKKVYLIHRRKWFRADPIEVEKVKKNEKIEIITPYIIKRIVGNERVEKIILEKTKEENGKIFPSGETKELEVNGVFVDIGLVPVTQIVKDLGVKIDEKGYIVVDDEMKTNIEGLFAAGDVTNKAAKLRQIVVAASQGAIAAFSAYKYLKTK